jgi:hypothetical protein
LCVIFEGEAFFSSYGVAGVVALIGLEVANIWGISSFYSFGGLRFLN